MITAREEPLSSDPEPFPGDDVGVVSYRGDGRIIGVNEAYASLVGYEPEELVGGSLRSLIPDSNSDTSSQPVWSHVPEGQTRVCEVDHRCSDGKTIPVEMTVTHVANNERAEYVAHVRDRFDPFDHRSLYERFRRILSDMGDGTYILDEDGRYVDVNENNPISGYEREEIIGAGPDLFHDEDDIEKFEWAIEDLLTNDPDGIQTVEATLQRADDERIPVEVKLTLLPGEDGVFRGTLGVVRDVSEKRERQRELDRYKKVLDTMPDTVAVTDLEGNHLAVHGFEGWSGYDKDEIVGENLKKVTTDEIAEKSVSKAEELFERDDLDKITYEHPILTKDGRVIPHENHMAFLPPEEEGGPPAGVVAVLRNITDRKQREKELERYETMVEAAGDPMYALDTRGRYIFTNDANLNLLGYEDRDELLGTPASEVMAEGTAKRLREFTKNMLSNDRRRDTLEMTYTTGDNEEIPVENHVALLIDDEDGFWASVNVVRDLSERKELEEKLRRQALYDELTGLPNRSLFMDRLEMHLSQLREDPDERFAVIYMDLDRFKMVNDSLGHQVGDELLEAVAERLEQTVDSTVTVARLGGDEFALLLDELESLEAALDEAERISREMEQPFELDGERIFSGASLGVVIPEPTEYEDAEMLLRDADIAMYRSKNSNEDYTLFEPGMHEETEAEMKLEMQLQDAIEDDQLEVHYQPILRLEPEALLGFEALVRWNHPDRGYLTPGEFLPLAKKTGYMLQIDRWVLRQACRDLKRWRTGHPDMDLSVSVNCSQVQFMDPAFVDLVEENLQELNLDPRALYLEITERTVVSSPDQATDVIRRLQEDGVHIVLDDFGTGYSSLSYLSTLPIDILKIDRSFVYKLQAEDANGESGQRMVRVIMNMAEGMDTEVIAEGIENQEQTQSLLSMDCTQGQGFHYAKPMQASEVETFIKDF